MRSVFRNHGAAVLARVKPGSQLNCQEIDAQQGDPDPRPAEIVRTALPCPLAQNIAVQVMEHTRDKDRQARLLLQVAADLRICDRVAQLAG
ncbi:hypothetical protein LCM17_18480 [Cereibacter sphaeroides]|nr:hypothetical protein [Cereibacter sphaeroides]